MPKQWLRSRTVSKPGGGYMVYFADSCAFFPTTSSRGLGVFVALGCLF
jgi:hypothetical protein